MFLNGNEACVGVGKMGGRRSIKEERKEFGESDVSKKCKTSKKLFFQEFECF